MRKKKLKIYGERNTGTNYLSKLIEINFDVDVLPGVVPRSVQYLQRLMPGNEFVRDVYFYFTYSRNLGWKHMYVNKDDINQLKKKSENISFVTLSKNPYSWLLSLYKRPYHQYYKEEMEFSKFLTQPWQTVGRENFQGEILNPIDLWNKKNLSYLSMSKCFPTQNLKFEDLLSNPEELLNRISNTFLIEWKVDTFQNFNRSTKGENKDTNYYRDYYLNEKWKFNISHRELRIINKNLDDNLMKHFGYVKLA